MKKNFLTLLLLSFLGVTGLYSQPNWYYTFNSSNHTILVPGTALLTIDNQPLVPGDFVGVFYDSLGTLACAGYSEFTGVNIAVAAWGEDLLTGGNNGFAANEAFKWKIYRASDGLVVDAEATYSTTGFPHTGFFAENGMSGVESLIAFSPATPELPWTFTNTGNNHTILVPGTATMTINNQPLVPGDYVGVFFDSLGTLACAGYAEITGQNTALTAWGVDATTGGNNGFANNEVFKWKIWRAVDGQIFNAEAEYNTVSFPHAGNYLVNGMSGIQSLTGITGVDIAVGNLVEPADPCAGLSTTEAIAFEIVNLGSANADTIYISYSMDNGTTVFVDTLYQSIAPGTAYIHFVSETFDLSVSGSYTFGVELETPNDLNAGNNAAILAINNFPPVVPDFNAMDTAFCSSASPVILEAQPTGGVYSSLNLPILTVGGNPVVFFNQPGSFEISYTYTDGNGCVSVVVQGFTVDLSPSLNLPANAYFCEDDEATVTAPAGFASYEWSNGSTAETLVVNQSGVYSLTVSAANGCTATDAITVNELPLPDLVFFGDAGFCEGGSTTIGVNAVSNAVYSWSNGSVNNQISVSDPDTYSVTITLNGCSVSDSLEVEEYPLPSIDLGADIESCEGETEILDAGIFTSYIWSTGATTATIEVSESDDYSVTVTDGNACSDSDNVEVDFLSLPEVDFNFTINELSVNFTSISLWASDFTWDFGDGNTSTEESPTHVYAGAGTYQVVHEAINYCGESEIEKEVIISLDVAENNTQPVRMMPNPVKESLTIQVEQEMGVEQINLYSMEGKLIRTIHTLKTDNQFTLSMADLSTGVYFVELKGNQHQSLHKIIKE